MAFFPVTAMKCGIERFGPGDVDAVMAIMAEATEGVGKEWFVADSREEVADRLAGGGVGLFAVCDGVRAGFLVVDLPGEAPRNLGHDLGLPPEAIARSAHMDSVCVRPAYRGRGLQKRLMGAAEAALAGMGIRHCLATVHPDNAASLASFLSLGYEIAATKPKYGGLIRHIMRKDLPVAT